MNCTVKDNPQIDTTLTINTIRVTATGATFVASTPFLYWCDKLTKMSRKTCFPYCWRTGNIRSRLCFQATVFTLIEEYRVVSTSFGDPALFYTDRCFTVPRKTSLENALGSVMIMRDFIIFPIFKACSCGAKYVFIVHPVLRGTCLSTEVHTKCQPLRAVAIQS